MTPSGAPDRLRACVADGRLTPDHRYIDAGFDLAFGGADRCALVIRRGADVLHAERWPGGDFEASCRRVYRRLMAADAERGGLRRCWYDATGGHPVGEALARADEGPNNVEALPVVFGERPAGPEMPFEHGVSNAAIFSRRNAQLAWAVRLRVLRPEDAPSDHRLRLPPDLPELAEFLRQCARPRWSEHRSSGRIEVEKGQPSPDLFDALTLAYAADSAYGLLAAQPLEPRWTW